MHMHTFLRGRAPRRALTAPLATALAFAAAGAGAAERAYAVVTLPDDARTVSNVARSLATWEGTGDVTSVSWIRSTPQDAPGFTTMAIVEFPGERAYGRWERRASGGFGHGVTVQRADLLAAGDHASAPRKPVLVKVNVYQPHVDPAHYASYVAQYVAPELDGLRASSGLVGYALYQGRDASGNGRSLLVREFADAGALAAAPAARDAIRRQLSASDDAFRQIDATRDTVRTDVSETRGVLVAR